MGKDGERIADGEIWGEGERRLTLGREGTDADSIGTWLETAVAAVVGVCCCMDSRQHSNAGRESVAAFHSPSSAGASPSWAPGKCVLCA